MMKSGSDSEVFYYSPEIIFGVQHQVRHRFLFDFINLCKNSYWQIKGFYIFLMPCNTETKDGEFNTNLRLCNFF